jgi:2-C-methyl-D-erythritol 4-phosphate cytidylyltransferase
MPMAYAIIVAGGNGVRMGTDTRKQYLSLANTPIIAHTLQSFDAAESIHQLILVLPKDDIDFIQKSIVSSLKLSTPFRMTAGGKTRQSSVYQGLLMVNDLNGIVAIHDGVRPFILPQEIDRCVETAKSSGACIMGIPVSETIKQVNTNDLIQNTIDRSNLWLAQTPQVFQYQMIRKAHDMALKEGFNGTDDAMLVERIGEQVKVLQGNRWNIKITTPDDLLLAEAFLKISSNEFL